MLRNPEADKELSDEWIEQMGPYCPDLVDYVDEHQDDYDAIIIVTYLYYPAVKSMQRVKDKVIFIPTAHQEPFIHFKMYREMFNAPKAYVFLTDEEKELVHSIFHNEDIPYEVMGVGVDVPKKPDAKVKIALECLITLWNIRNVIRITVNLYLWVSLCVQFLNTRIL